MKTNGWLVGLIPDPKRFVYSAMVFGSVNYKYLLESRENLAQVFFYPSDAVTPNLLSDVKLGTELLR